MIEVLSVEPFTFYEFNNSIANPAVLAIIDFAPLPGSIIYDVSPNIAFTIIDRLLGWKRSRTWKEFVDLLKLN